MPVNLFFWTEKVGGGHFLCCSRQAEKWGDASPFPHRSTPMLSRDHRPGHTFSVTPSLPHANPSINVTRHPAYSGPPLSRWWQFNIVRSPSTWRLYARTFNGTRPLFYSHVVTVQCCWCIYVERGSPVVLNQYVVKYCASVFEPGASSVTSRWANSRRFMNEYLAIDGVFVWSNSRYI